MIEHYNDLFEVTIPRNNDTFDESNELLEQISQWVESCDTDYPINKFGMCHEYTFGFILVTPTMELAVEAAMRFG